MSKLDVIFIISLIITLISGVESFICTIVYCDAGDKTALKLLKVTSIIFVIFLLISIFIPSPEEYAAVTGINEKLKQVSLTTEESNFINNLLK